MSVFTPCPQLTELTVAIATRHLQQTGCSGTRDLGPAESELVLGPSHRLIFFNIPEQEYREAFCPEGLSLRQVIQALIDPSANVSSMDCGVFGLSKVFVSEDNMKLRGNAPRERPNSTR